MGDTPRQEQLDLSSATSRQSGTDCSEPVQGRLFPDDSVPDELVGYRGPTACQIAGITYRQLDYWARTVTGRAVHPQRRGLREPAAVLVQGHPGPQDRQAAAGHRVSLHNIRVAVDHLRQRGVRDLANITLFSDGTTVYECTSPEEVVDLLQGGQGVRHRRSGAMRETHRHPDFPGERADGGESIAAPEDELASLMQEAATARSAEILRSIG